MKQTIRLLITFLLLLTGSSEIWADDVSKNLSVNITPSGAGTVSATAVYTECNTYLTVTVRVKPNNGYYSQYNWITIYNSSHGRVAQKASTTVISAGGTSIINYTIDGSSLDVVSSVTVSFKKIPKLALQSNLGDDNFVQFYDGGTTKPDASTFNPSSYTNSIEEIDNSDGKDHYVIAHIVPLDDDTEPSDRYWTDQSLLSAVETGTSGTGVANTITMLKRDQYVAANSGDPSDMRDRYDGAGWYYYILPKDHSIAKGYSASIVNGFVPEKFNLSESDRVSQNVNEDGTAVVTVTDGTENGWKALIAVDKVSFPFDGSEKSPTITGITIKNGSETKFNLTDPDDIARHLYINGSTAKIARNPLGLCGEMYQIGNDWFYLKGWFTSTCDSEKAYFDITVPFDGNGTEGSPWQIKTVDDMNLFALCVNVGQYQFCQVNESADGPGEIVNEYVELMNDLTYTDEKSALFKPVGMTNAFLGHFNGGGKTIKNLKMVIGENDDTWTCGLFGYVGGLASNEQNSIGTVNSLKLDECTFDGSGIAPLFVGAIAGLLSPGSSISDCIVSSSTISGKAQNCNVGGIAGSIGEIESMMGSVETRAVSPMKTRAAAINTIENCIVDGCTISNATTNGGETIKNWTGGIVGVATKGSLSGNRVKGSTTITSEVDNTVDYPIGAIFGETNNTTLSDNLYAKAVKVIRKKGTSDETTVEGYTKRGYWTGSDFDDINDATKGAMMEVYPVTLSCSAPHDDYTASLEIDSDDPSTQTVETLEAGANCYKIVDATDNSPAKYYFAPDDVINLAVSDNLLTRSDDIRTFYADLSLTMNETALTATDGKASFTMPSEDAAVKATYTEAGGFTITTNQKKWMSFFHNWGDNYTVSDPTSTNSSRTRAATNPVSSFEVLTIAKDGIDLNAGTATTLDLEGVSYSRVPTLFHSESNLPRLLRFEPTNVTGTPQYDNQFMGGVSDLSGYASQTVYLLFNSELVRADLSGGTEFNEHKAFVAIGGNANTRSLVFVDGETTAISLTPTLSEIEGVWHNLQGLRLDGKPTKKGLYIMNGKKVVIK